MFEEFAHLEGIKINMNILGDTNSLQEMKSSIPDLFEKTLEPLFTKIRAKELLQFVSTRDKIDAKLQTLSYLTNLSDDKIWEAYHEVITHPNFFKVSLDKLKDSSKTLVFRL